LLAEEQKKAEVDKIMFKLEFYVDYWTDYYQIDGMKDRITKGEITKDRVYDLGLGMIKHESGFAPYGITYEKKLKVNSWGLTRLLETTARDMGWNGKDPKELLDPDTNLKYGIKYLCWQIHRYHSLKKAVAAYNAGHIKYRKDGITYVNQRYVDMVYYDYYHYYRNCRNCNKENIL
jgi:soluble lytic murein transglycosylase-like protein